ncbi:MAG: SGNH/GDSL hydrolase family protein [Bacteroidetes bacterium]|nr:MAG: SGNH/GDSL hydrolase family protein [Bacteroidota bacterium]
MFRLLGLSGFILILAATRCRQESTSDLVPDSPVPAYSYLALGDSYTVGESVARGQNFPNQLKDSLYATGLAVADPLIIAKTGWRTDQLKNAVAASENIKDSVFSLVTLCIGVNNQFQNSNFDTYKSEFEDLLQQALAFTGGDTGRVIVLSIPDWAYTPFGQAYANDPATVSQEIDTYNAANRSITESYGVTYIDVTSISRNGLDQPGLVAADGLHPSVAQYSEWVKLLWPVAKKVLTP